MLLKFHLWLRELAFSRSLSLEFQCRLCQYLLPVAICLTYLSLTYVFVLDCVWNVMAHAQKLDFVFWRNGRVHLNRRGRQFSRLLAAEFYASAVVMLDTPCSEVVWRVLATHSIRQFPLHFPSRASPCGITFQLDSTPVGQLSYLIPSDAFARLTTSSRSSHFHSSRSERKRISWSGRFLVNLLAPEFGI